jgi:hypothetical protein
MPNELPPPSSVALHKVGVKSAPLYTASFAQTVNPRNIGIRVEEGPSLRIEARRQVDRAALLVARKTSEPASRMQDDAERRARGYSMRSVGDGDERGPLCAGISPA